MKFCPDYSLLFIRVLSVDGRNVLDERPRERQKQPVRLLDPALHRVGHDHHIPDLPKLLQRPYHAAGVDVERGPRAVVRDGELRLAQLERRQDRVVPVQEEEVPRRLCFSNFFITFG